jgi:hypothetical protein
VYEHCVGDGIISAEAANVYVIVVVGLCWCKDDTHVFGL